MVTRSQDKLTSVQIIQVQNDLALIQWEDSHKILRRNWVKQNDLRHVQGRLAEVANPSEGIPYGVEFWRLVQMRATPQDFDRKLKEFGIWTIADARSRPNEVVSALQATYGTDLGTFFQALEVYEKELSTEA